MNARMKISLSSASVCTSRAQAVVLDREHLAVLAHTDAHGGARDPRSVLISPAKFAGGRVP